MTEALIGVGIWLGLAFILLCGMESKKRKWKKWEEGDEDV